MSSQSSSDSPSSSSRSPTITRPNRWLGAPSTWQNITAQERGLAASLDALRDRDLGVHLYNAWALKKRARIGVLELQEEEDEDKDDPFIPPKSWTAWPLPPEQVPREGEVVGEKDIDEKFTYKRRERARPSGMLEDVLTGLWLKSSKKRFDGRDWETEQKNSEMDIDSQGSVEVSHEGQDEDGEDALIIMQQSESARDKLHMKPVTSADDERSRKILIPTIRHTLSKLDDVLMALHHTRKTCRMFSSQSALLTEDETQSANEEEHEATSGLKGRPRKFENLTYRSKSQEIPVGQITSNELLRSKKPGRGRRPKQYPRVEGETDQEYLIRIARIQKKPLPVFAPSRAAGITSSPKAPVKPSTHRKNKVPPMEAAKKYQQRLGVRDWSEVLGSAALVGFPPDVIARATQRCANLFGESMTMRTMIETPFCGESVDVLDTYQPEAIPDLGSESEGSGALNESSHGSDQSGQRRPAQPKAVGYAPKLETRFCPIKGCPRQVRGFSSVQRLQAHFKNGHKMTKEEIAEFDVPSDEEMDGAVHVDGFLKPEKRAYRGHDRKQRKRRKKVEVWNESDK